MTNSDSKPQFISQDKLQDFLDSHSKITFVDAFLRQVKELFFIENHQFIGMSEEEAFASKEFKAYEEFRKNDFVHIFYLWNGTLVKCINADDYFSLKTNRNQDLITAEEQKKLYDYKVAVLGMSVGSNIAFMLTQAGISQEIYLADFDELDTTNLNRILAGVHQVGLNKTVIAARRIYEDNPFAKVTLFQEGINSENLEELLKNKKINCVVEEIDNIPFKIEARKLALKYKIPVVMITDNGDGVVLHIERYDLGHDQIFHESPEFWDNKFKGKVDKQLAGKIIIENIVGGADKVDPKMIASVQRVFKKELVSWSQLGSAAILGGVAATVAIKRIALGESKSLNVREYIFMPNF